jgi:hypothetical protein
VLINVNKKTCHRLGLKKEQKQKYKQIKRNIDMKTLKRRRKRKQNQLKQASHLSFSKEKQK